MNSKLKIILFIILLFIPTYLAVGSYISEQSGSIEDARDIERMEIGDPDGKTYLFVPEGEDEEAVRTAKAEIDFLASMNKNAKEQKALPDAIADAETFTVTYHTFNRKSIYEYYFTDDPDAAFFKDPEGVIYKIDQADASAFLCKDYAASLYNGSVYPTLTIGSTPVLPRQLDWRYQLFNGTYRPLETETTDEMHNYRMNARLSFSFNLEPDVIDITVYDGEEVIYKDNYANLSKIVLTEQKQLRFHIDAKWYEVDGKEGQGEAVYDFMATVNAPASFYLNADSIGHGEFCVITVKDKPETDSIAFVSEPDLGFTPTFVEDGDYYRALVPIGCDKPSGTYTFTLSCDGVTQELTLNVSDKTYKEVDFKVSQDTINATRTEATLASFDEIMGPVARSLTVAADHMFEGTWGEGVPSGAMLFTGYGVTRSVNGGSPYRHMGVDYYLAEGNDITAINNGVVVYVGSTDLSGNIVVIDHGLGLKSWYAHLSEITVSRGDTVKTGDVIAKSGMTGFCNQGTAHIAMTVFDVAICPYSYWENPIVLNNP